MNGPELHTIAGLDARLQELHKLTAQTPTYNPVFQLGLELSRKLESGEMGLDAVGIAGLRAGVRGPARARRAARPAGPSDAPPADNDARIDAAADEDDFTAFAVRWQRPAAHVVFTAHPTFLLSAAQSEAVTHAASSGDFAEATVCAASPARDTITLDYEHAAAMAAIARGQKARDRINERLFSIAAARFPKRWKKPATDAGALRPLGGLRHGRAHRYLVVHLHPLPA
ncbi:hypothetical protein ACFSTD_02870 [Novosphingobium colocasiae]